jgi:signal transduction histidine kinase
MRTLTADQVSRLLSLISHEVRAPLGVMRGYVRLLEQQPGTMSDHQRQAVAAALRAAERGAAILDQVSLLARLFRQETRLSHARVPLETLLAAASKAVTLPQEPRVTLTLGTPPPVTIEADTALLSQAIAGLIGAVVRAQTEDCRVFVLADEDATAGIRGVALTITAMEAIGPTHAEHPLDIDRGGLGLDLPLAQAVIETHRGDVHERRAGDRLVGIVVWLPLA